MEVFASKLPFLLYRSLAGLKFLDQILELCHFTALLHRSLPALLGQEIDLVL